MGVYHFMGLGRSVGAVIGPVSYLAMRFNRWNPTDREFFGLSGEHAQRKRGEKVGDIQSIVLFTTPEVYAGCEERFYCFPYVVNRKGHCPAGAHRQEPSLPMRDALSRLLPSEWRHIANGRDSVKLYWCEVDRTDLRGTFQRVAQVLLTAKSVGALGKEIWINMMGGNNVINLALQLSATLMGMPARFYYVQAEDEAAQKCVYYTREEGYWVDLPILPVVANEASRVLAETVAESGEMNVTALLQKAKTHPQHWALFHLVGDSGAFARQYVRPLAQQGLLEEKGDRVRVGRVWQTLQPYYETLREIGAPREGFGASDRT